MLNAFAGMIIGDLDTHVVLRFWCARRVGLSVQPLDCYMYPPRRPESVERIHLGLVLSCAGSFRRVRSGFGFSSSCRDYASGEGASKPQSGLPRSGADTEAHKTVTIRSVVSLQSFQQQRSNSGLL